MALQTCLLPFLSSSPSKPFVSPLPFRRSYINISVIHRLTKLHISSATSNPTPTTPETETNFDWFSHWNGSWFQMAFQICTRFAMCQHNRSDTMVVAFRSWLRKYSNNQVNWSTKGFAVLPTSPPREQLMDRYWSHVVHCKSCRGALRAMKTIKVSLQIVSIALIGILAAANHSIISNRAKTGIVAMAITFFAASHWLSQFIHKTFYYHDYNHAIFRTTNTHMEKILGALRSLTLTF